MKRIILFLIVGLMLLGGVVYAQSTSENVSVTLIIPREFSLDGVGTSVDIDLPKTGYQGTYPLDPFSFVSDYAGTQVMFDIDDFTLGDAHLQFEGKWNGMVVVDTSGLVFQMDSQNVGARHTIELNLVITGTGTLTPGNYTRNLVITLATS